MKIKFNRFQSFYEGNDFESDQARENQADRTTDRVGCATTRWELLGEKWTENDCLPIRYTAEERGRGTGLIVVAVARLLLAYFTLLRVAVT